MVDQALAASYCGLPSLCLMQVGAGCASRIAIDFTRSFDFAALVALVGRIISRFLIRQKRGRRLNLIQFFSVPQWEMWAVAAQEAVIVEGLSHGQVLHVSSGSKLSFLSTSPNILRSTSMSFCSLLPCFMPGNSQLMSMTLLSYSLESLSALTLMFLHILTLICFTSFSQRLLSRSILMSAFSLAWNASLSRCTLALVGPCLTNQTVLMFLEISTCCWHLQSSLIDWFTMILRLHTKGLMVVCEESAHSSNLTVILYLIITALFLGPKYIILLGSHLGSQNVNGKLYCPTLAYPLGNACIAILLTMISCFP
ncbi:hypothetical protein FGO68_gene5549 [Halteria grandinella]|uniref:Uncharacterized protein n=1 Tax=Halteria grandinella TaxID=5974 RepID=A0A8J8NRZ3_HALGN|nr:hypothetical protein FGO68_gene5549 [Halteria grandinella]